jgi:tRNA pseudouridine synthase 9
MAQQPPPTYVFTGDRRRVEPYVYAYTMHCKGRWCGRRPDEVFGTEFKMNPPSYYEEALRDGRITVNDALWDGQSTLQQGDVIRHLAHRHEPPVPRGPIRVVGLTENALAVDKPPGLPMHPCGSYHHNTLTSLLREDFTARSFVCADGVEWAEAQRAARQGLRQVHRLDRLTSGLVIFARSAQSARTLCEDIGQGRTQKTYVARVRGCFPDDAPVVRPEKRPRNGELTDGSWRIDGDWVEVSCSLRTASHRDGVCECAPNADDAKAARTKFRLVRKLSDGTSVVECRPQTGRTHQIRLHLQFLNHPIANDPCYGGELGFAGSSLVDEAPPASSEVLDPTGPRRPGESDADFVRRKCARCAAKLDVIDASEERAACVFLHARSYAGPGWAFATAEPAWATE